MVHLRPFGDTLTSLILQQLVDKQNHTIQPGRNNVNHRYET